MNFTDLCNLPQKSYDILFKPCNIPNLHIGDCMAYELKNREHMNKKQELISKLYRDHKKLREFYVNKIVNYIYPDYFTDNTIRIIISSYIIYLNDKYYIPYEVHDMNNNINLYFY